MISKKVLVVVSITFITIIAWVILDILHSRSEVKIPSETQKLLTPVEPNFDQGVIDGL